jgi:phosphatidylserine decarboxylase
MIARDAFRFLIPLFILTAASFWMGWVAVGVFLFLLMSFVAFFFRNPTRTIPQDPSIIVSPADGKVVKIDRVGGVTKVSIFLSLFNVHVNRSPIAGRVEAVDYRKGSFKAAYNHAASVENERNVIMVSNGHIKMVFIQIAGVVARRIVFWKHIGDTVEKGDLVGLIRFGSRVDILFPAGTEVTVAVGDRVRGGASPIGVIVKTNG